MALMIAVKYCDDDLYSNTCFSQIIGIDVKSINRMEIEFLMLINF
jgi:hypothetical protein